VAGLAATLVTRKIVSATFLIALLQPFGIFSSIMWRDSVGQLFLVAGSLLIFQFRGGLLEIGKAIIGCFMLMLLRNIYLVTGILAIIVRLTSQARGRKAAIYPRFAVLVVFLIASYLYVSDLSLSFYTFEGNRFTYSKDSFSIIKGLAIALVGPFPWTQIFDPAVPGREYLLADIFQAMFSLSILFLLLRGLVRKKIPWREQPYLTIISLVLMIMTLGMLSHGHVSYVAVATVLLLPLIPHLNATMFFHVFAFFTGFNCLFGSIYSLF
jgi:hypothetical protein